MTVEYRMDANDWLRGLILMAAGKNSDIIVAPWVDGDFVSIEILGPLPRQLRQGLRRYPLARDINDQLDYAITWRTTPDGYGTSLAIETLLDALNLVSERRNFLAGKKVKQAKNTAKSRKKASS